MSEHDHQAKKEADQRFERTVRNLLRTPHKPHEKPGKDKPISATKPSRSGKTREKGR